MLEKTYEDHTSKNLEIDIKKKWELVKMNIQDEMDRIFKMQKDNLANERKFI
jgi:hypothetical protein